MMPSKDNDLGYDEKTREIKEEDNEEEENYEVEDN